MMAPRKRARGKRAKGKRARTITKKAKDVDLINELPETLISSIISFLPLNEAVATSIVCRRWRSLWQWISQVKFDPKLINPWKSILLSAKASRHEIGSEDILMMGKIDDMMTSLLLNSNITVCEIIQFPAPCGIYKFLAKQQSFEQLSLVCDTSFDNTGKTVPRQIPRGTFQGNKLSMLKLTYYRIADALVLDGCLNLKTLTLDKVRLGEGDVTLSGIFKCCPNLETLVFQSCFVFDFPRNEFNIRSEKLKSLEITQLEVWTNVCSMITDKLSIQCPNLKELSLYYCRCEHVADILENTSRLMLGKEGDKNMKDLQVLRTTLNLNNHRHIHVLSEIIDASANLQEINLTNKGYYWLENDNSLVGENIWATREFSSKLRWVRISGFLGKKEEIIFASLLIKKATGLKEIVIECSDECSNEGMSNTCHLLLVPRASDDVSVVLKPGKEYMAKFGNNFQVWMDSFK